MSQVPDLNNFNNKSWVAYYDVTEHTDLNSIDTEYLNNNLDGSNEITPYDNGVVINYKNVPTREEYIIRGSTNGIITAHMKTQENYFDFNNQTSNYKDCNGLVDILDWKKTDQSLDDNVLQKTIKKSLSGLDTWDSDISSEYNKEDVKLYNSRFGDNSKVSIFTQSKSTGGGGTEIVNLALSYTDETTVRKMIIGVSGNGDSSTSSRIYADLNNDNRFFDFSSSNRRYAMYDITDMYTPGDQLEIDLVLNKGWREFMNIYVLVIWS